MARIERAIQAAVIRWVQEQLPDLTVVATSNEAHYRDTGQIGSLGVPDLILFKPDGGVLFLELKRKNGRLLKSQVAWNARYDALGFPHPRAVAYGYKQAISEIGKFAGWG